MSLPTGLTVVCILSGAVMVRLIFSALRDPEKPSKRWEAPYKEQPDAPSGSAAEHVGQEPIGQPKALAQSGQQQKAWIPPATISPGKFVEELTRRGYFNYADPKDIPQLQEEAIANAEKYGLSICLEDSMEPLKKPTHYRLQGLDGEELYDQWRFAEIIAGYGPAFQKMGVKMEITDKHTYWDTENKWRDYSVVVNGTRYIILEHYNKRSGQGSVAQRFCEIVNAELEKQHSAERLYLIGIGNEGHAYFLTEELFKYIDSMLPYENGKPLPIDRWCAVNKIDPKAYLGK